MRRDTEGSEILIYFNCDYTEGCHPNILKRLCETNMMQTVGYGEDEICDLARAKIRKACGREDVDVHFLVGGTQTNATVIAAIFVHPRTSPGGPQRTARRGRDPRR